MLVRPANGHRIYFIYNWFVYTKKLLLEDRVRWKGASLVYFNNGGFLKGFFQKRLFLVFILELKVHLFEF